MISLPLQGVGAAGAGAHDATLTPQAPPPRPDASPTAPQTPPPSVPPPALSAAAALQGGLAPLLADLEAALSAPGLPAAVQAAASRVLGFGLGEDPPPSAADLAASVSRSGLFLEARLAGGDPPADDFKAALLRLAGALTDWSNDHGASSGRPVRAAPSPPFAGGPLRGQATASPSVGADTPAGALAQHLLGETRAALARQVLMQSASAQGASKGADTGRPEARWLFELPLAGRDGRSVAQFEVARDGQRGAGAEGGRTWRSRFSLDVEGLGPVHAALSLTGGRLHVALWAEHPATETALSQGQGQLRTALEDDGLSAEVNVRPGAPPTPAAPAGRFMDTAA